MLTTVDGEGDTNRETKSHSDTLDKQTHGQGHGHGTTRHGTAQELQVCVCVSVQSSLGVVAKWVGPVLLGEAGFITLTFKLSSMRTDIS